MFWRKSNEIKEKTTDLTGVFNAIGETKALIVELKARIDGLDDQIASLRSRFNRKGGNEDTEAPKNLNTAFSINPFK